MVGLPKSIIKKYGVTKKAWAVFRGAKTHHVNRGGYVKKGHKRGHSRGGSGGFLRHGILPSMGTGIMGLAISAAAGYAVVKFISPRLPQVVPMQNLALGAVAGGVPGAVGAFLAGGMGGGSNGGYI